MVASMQDTVTVMMQVDDASAPEAVEVPRRVGTVRIGELIGEGTGGVVFIGFDEVLHRKVAVKILRHRQKGASDSVTVEMLSGVRTAAALRHPNIVTVHAVEMSNSVPVVVMELIDGLSLRQLLTRVGAMDVPLALFVMKAITGGVEALHEANIVHRDLKPANILVDRRGNAYVCDFGLASTFDVRRARITADGIGGSPLYMSPEAFDGHASPQSDVYALGVMLYELLAGVPPFSGRTLSEVMAQHQSREPDFAPLEARLAGERSELRESLCEIITRAIHKQRILRYRSAHHLLRALENLRVPGRPDELRARLSLAVAVNPADAQTRAQESREESTPLTTFELVRKRAAEKRENRGDGSTAS